MSEAASDPPPSSRALLAVKIASILLVIGLAGLTYQQGYLADFANPRSFARAVVDMGAWGYVGFVLAYALFQPFGAPGTAFIVAAPLIWPWPVAFALSMTGTMAASVLGFSFARFVARDWVEARIPERFRRYDRALERNALQTVFILRLIFWMPQALHAFFGVSRVPFVTHFWGSLLGYLPPLFLVSYMGAELFDDRGNMQPTAFVVLGILLVCSLALAAFLRLRERHRALAEGA